MVVPEGFALPPVAYSAPLLVAVLAVATALVRIRPAVTESTVLALVPWMAAGAALHALYQLPIDLGGLAPLLGTPAVYLTTFAVAGASWLVLDRARENPAQPLAALGALAFLVLLGIVLASGDDLSVVWPAAIVLISGALTAAAVAVFRRFRPELVAPDRRLASTVLFAHALDGVSTGVGFDVFEFQERTPLSRVILEFSASLPTADLLGAGWLFVLVKLAVAAAVVALFADYVRERPAEGYLLLGFVAAVGLGPGVQNVLLFAAG